MRLDHLTHRFAAAARQSLAGADRRLAASASKLDALSPLKVLGRGYSIGYDEKGQVLNRVTQTKIGDRLTWRLADGTVGCTVTTIQEAEYDGNGMDF